MPILICGMSEAENIPISRMLSENLFHYDKSSHFLWIHLWIRLFDLGFSKYKILYTFCAKTKIENQ